MTSPLPVPAETTPGRLAVALTAAFGTGVVVATQSRLNGELGLRLGDGFLAAFISFGSGLLILAVASLFWRPGRRGVERVAVALRERNIPWWIVLGGAGGAFFVLGQGLTIGALGVALFTIAVVCGQTVSSLLLDHWGLAHRGSPLMPATPATPRRVLGAALAVVAVGIAVSDRLRPDAPYLLLVVPLLAGLVVGWQQAVNGQVRRVSGSAFTATFGNFAVGTGVLGLALLAHILVAGWHPEFPTQWWLYLGGLAGCIFIGAQAIIVRHTGVLLMGLALLAGQVTASIAFDLLLPVSDSGLHLVTVVGGALVVVAVVVAALPARVVRAS